MRVVQRLKNLLRGRAHDVLDQLERPRDQLAVLVDELQSQVQSLQVSVVAAIADEKKMRIEMQDHLGKAGDWESRALLALEQGDESLARQAVEKKTALEARAIALHGPWESQKAAVQRLKDAFADAKKQVDEAKRRYTLLLARHQSAETRQKLEVSLSKKGTSNAAQMMEALEDRIRRIEAETEAHIETNGEWLTDDLERTFVGLEKTRGIDQSLDALKARLTGDSREVSIETVAGNTLDPVAELKRKLRE